MLKDNDIIIISLASWGIDIGSNSKDIALEFAKNNRVLYVNRSPDRSSVLKGIAQSPLGKQIFAKKPKQEQKIQLIQPNLWNLTPTTILESINYLPPGKFYNYLNYRNHKKFSQEIRSALQSLGFEDVILINDNDFLRGYYLKELLQHNRYVYYLRDFLTFQPYFKKHGSQLETELMKKSDLVVANSRYLADYARQYQPHAYDIGQGCDLWAFKQPEYDKPFVLSKIAGSIVGYVGALDSNRLDIELISKIASSLTDWQIVLVGPEDQRFQQSGLHQMENVHFIGSIAPSEVPSYMYHFDVCINPQKLNDLTLGNYPRKIDEYLALGKPVVSLRTNTMEMFEEYVYLAQDHESFVSQISLALSQNDPEQVDTRKEFAYSHTWEASVGKLAKALSHDNSKNYA